MAEEREIRVSRKMREAGALVLAGKVVIGGDGGAVTPDAMAEQVYIAMARVDPFRWPDVDEEGA